MCLSNSGCGLHLAKKRDLPLDILPDLVSVKSLEVLSSIILCVVHAVLRGSKVGYLALAAIYLPVKTLVAAQPLRRALLFHVSLTHLPPYTAYRFRDSLTSLLHKPFLCASTFLKIESSRQDCIGR